VISDRRLAAALQTAAIEPRVTTVVAAEVLADLRTIATERAPVLLPGFLIAQAFRLAESAADSR
jgi:hypothetical protein